MQQKDWLSTIKKNIWNNNTSTRQTSSDEIKHYIELYKRILEFFDSDKLSVKDSSGNVVFQGKILLAVLKKSFYVWEEPVNETMCGLVVPDGL